MPGQRGGTVVVEGKIDGGSRARVRDAVQQQAFQATRKAVAEKSVRPLTPGEFDREVLDRHHLHQSDAVVVQRLPGKTLAINERADREPDAHHRSARVFLARPEPQHRHARNIRVVFEMRRRRGIPLGRRKVNVLHNQPVLQLVRSSHGHQFAFVRR